MGLCITMSLLEKRGIQKGCNLVVTTTLYLKNFLELYFLFKHQGIVDVLCEACEQLKWKAPTKIQKEAIPVALQGILVNLFC